MHQKIPITLLTGFLGAGKSTLIQRILGDPRFSDTAVVVNEFGDIGLDGALIVHSPDQVLEVTTGCLCCTVRGDIRDTLLRLHADAELGRMPLFERVLIETTGLADPVPVIATLMRDPRLVRRFALAGVITVIDCLTGAETFEAHEEAARQVALADRIVVTKTDLATGAERRAARDRTRDAATALNPRAPQLDAQPPSLSLPALVDLPAFDPSARSLDVRRWLSESVEEGNHQHQAHDVNRHSQSLRAFSLQFHEPVPTKPFTLALEAMTERFGPALLRVKGVAQLAETPDTPIAFHGVRHIFHEPMVLQAWPDGPRGTMIVFIVDGLDPAEIVSLFADQGLTPKSVAA